MNRRLLLIVFAWILGGIAVLLVALVAAFS
jgi:hypothetical protein